ncbi:hypothetical protein T484DRAFT_2509837 [Baffinella frigidus]|nr:hypothetical protein T484DRAFT_2509837 [Cryptophyta sp. CCMP2293]
MLQVAHCGCQVKVVLSQQDLMPTAERTWGTGAFGERLLGGAFGRFVSPEVHVLRCTSCEFCYIIINPVWSTSGGWWLGPGRRRAPPGCPARVFRSQVSNSPASRGTAGASGCPSPVGDGTAFPNWSNSEAVKLQSGQSGPAHVVRFKQGHPADNVAVSRGAARASGCPLPVGGGDRLMVGWLNGASGRRHARAERRSRESPIQSHISPSIQRIRRQDPEAGLRQIQCRLCRESSKTR